MANVKSLAPSKLSPKTIKSRIKHIRDDLDKLRTKYIRRQQTLYDAIQDIQARCPHKHVIKEIRTSSIVGEYEVEKCDDCDTDLD